MLTSKNLSGDMSGRLGPRSYVSVVLATFSIIFHCSALGYFMRVIREDKKKNMKNTNGEKSDISNNCKIRPSEESARVIEITGKTN